MQEYTPEFTFAPELTGRRLDEISALLAVMDTGGFAPAARVLGRDASVLSRRVTALEQRLGIRLIERTTRSVKPTEAGARFAERMRAALAAMTEAELEASDTGTTPRGTLRLALPRAFGRMWIAPLLPEFLSAFPYVRVEASYADRYVDLVADGYDVAIRVGDLPDSGLVARKLANQYRLICAAPSYLAARGTPMTPADLGMHDCMQFTRLRSFPEWRFRQGNRIESVKVSGPLFADDAESLIPAAVASHGLILSSEWLVGPELADGRLVQVLPDWTVDGEGAIYLVRPSTRFTAGKTRAFADWISNRLSSPPWKV